MQNWYSQNNPLRSKGVEEGWGVGCGADVAVGMAARVDATACRIWALGSGVVLGAQDASRNRSKMNFRGMRFIALFYPISDDIHHY
jgi:hypothetical protein